MTITCPITEAKIGATLRRFTVEGADDACWPWIGALDSDGYGSLRWSCECGSRHHSGAHRLNWILRKGPIPEGLTIDHLCRCKPCQNPAHMRIATVSENSSARGLKATHCRNGHEFTAANTYWIQPTAKCASLRRTCRACSLEQSARFHEVRRERRGQTKREFISAETVMIIRSAAAGGERVVDISRRLGLTYQIVESAAKGRTHRDVGGPLITSRPRKKPQKKVTIQASRRNP